MEGQRMIESILVSVEPCVIGAFGAGEYEKLAVALEISTPISFRTKISIPGSNLTNHPPRRERRHGLQGFCAMRRWRLRCVILGSEVPRYESN